MGVNKTLLASILAGMGGGVDNTNITALSGGAAVTFSWITSAPAYGRVQIGASPGSYTIQIDDLIGLDTTQTIVADASDGLVVGQTYYYRVGASLHGLAWFYSVEQSFVFGVTSIFGIPEFGVAAFGM